MKVMKRSYLFILAAAVTLLAACAKELVDKEIVQEGVEQTALENLVTITAGLEPISKVALTQGEGCVKTAWEAGDQIKIDDKVFTIESGIGQQSASFTGTAPDGSGPYTVAILPKAARMSSQAQTGDSDPSGQPWYAVLSGVADYTPARQRLHTTPRPHLHPLPARTWLRPRHWRTPRLRHQQPSILEGEGHFRAVLPRRSRRYLQHALLRPAARTRPHRISLIL